MVAKRRRFTDNVRIGPISVIALIAILSMAILAVLAVSTSNASLVISQRQAAAIGDAYLAETAAQDFLAGIDGELAAARRSSGTASGAVQKELPAIARHAEEQAEGRVTVSAVMEDGQVKASFSCAGGRTLNVKVSVTSAGKTRIDEWSMAAVQNTAQPGGSLWTGE